MSKTSATMSGTREMSTTVPFLSAFPERYVETAHVRLREPKCQFMKYGFNCKAPNLTPSMSVSLSIHRQPNNGMRFAEGS